MNKARVIGFGAAALAVIVFLFDPLGLISSAPEKEPRSARQEASKASKKKRSGDRKASEATEVKPDAAYYEKKTDWSAPTGSKMNISSFAFRDINRNGAYDMDDFPMAGVAFEMRGPGKSRVVKRSNLNGFGNFVMSAKRKKKADIIEDGDYTFRALTPPGWILTSDNGIQKMTITRKPGAIGDMISSTPAAPIGFAQSLNIRGRVQTPDGGATEVVATSPSGNETDVPLDEDGTFLIEAEKGDWSIKVSGPSGMTATRTVNVDRAPVLLSEIKLGEPEPAPDRETRTLHFDDLLITKSVMEIPGGYGDVDWRNWVATHNRTYGGVGYVNTTISGEFVAYNSSGHPVKVLSEKPFDFVGAYFGVAWRRAEGETLLLEGWRGDERVYRDEIELSAIGPVYFSADYRDVTLLKLSTRHYWQFVSDDMTFGFKD